MQKDDVIYRQAAIDAVHEAGITEYDETLAIEEIERVPSAQPAPCEFCRHNNIADDKACLMCSAERRTDEVD